MNPTDDVVSQQLEQIKRQRELAELQANPDTYDRHRLPWESKDKYGRDSIDVKDEDRGEIEGALGIIDRSEVLICELQPSEIVNRHAGPVASAPPTSMSPSTDAVEDSHSDPGTRPSAEQRRSTPKYRSRLKLHIRLYLTDYPDATAVQVCDHLDEEGFDATVLPKSWLRGSNRELAVAYRSNPTTRGKIDVMISKVRGDLGLKKPK
jgi:hypothetical protein